MIALSSKIYTFDLPTSDPTYRDNGFFVLRKQDQNAFDKNTSYFNIKIILENSIYLFPEDLCNYISPRIEETIHKFPRNPLAKKYVAMIIRNEAKTC